MERTILKKPAPAKRRSTKKARAKGESLAEFLREALEEAVKQPDFAANQRKRRAALAAMIAFGEKAPAGPPDLSVNVDDYIYGPIRKSNT